jgi:hypothetical protein
LHQPPNEHKSLTFHTHDFRPKHYYNLLPLALFVMIMTIVTLALTSIGALQAIHPIFKLAIAVGMITILFAPILAIRYLNSKNAAILLAADRVIEYDLLKSVRAFTYDQIIEVKPEPNGLRIQYYPYDKAGKLNYDQIRETRLIEVADRAQFGRELRARISGPKPSQAVYSRYLWWAGIPIFYFLGGPVVFFLAILLIIVLEQILPVFEFRHILLALLIFWAIGLFTLPIWHTGEYGGVPISKKKRKDP